MSDDLATGLAVAGFVLAVVSLTWQFWFTHRVDRARLRVNIDELRLVGDPNPPIGKPIVLRVVGITVTNVGRRATVVTSVNPVLGKRHRIRRSWVWPKKWQPTYELLPFVGADQELISTRLPIRLEPGDEANIYVGLEQLQGAMRGRTERRIRALSGSSTAGSQWSRAIEIPSREASA
jgi:hypothetical protein